MKLQPYTIALLFLGFSDAWAEETRPPRISEVQAAEYDGNAERQFQLARASLQGAGVPKDVKKAFSLMKAAADQGHADAIGGLGYFYSAGIAVERDAKLAAEWFRKGAEKGSAKAQLNLGKILLEAKGGSRENAEQLYNEGLQWIKKAADQGLPEAGVSYGSMLYFGDHGVSKDFDKAATYFKNAAEQGFPDAQNFLGIMSELGVGIPLDSVVAEQWFRKAALQGHAKAQGNLGRILNPLAENKETRIEALAWLIISTSLGEVTAQKSLEDALPGLKKGEFEAAKKKATDLRKLIHR